MATSKKQIQANRKNAKKSTGPKTAEGKATVATNAIQHGVLSNQLILPNEDEDRFRTLQDELVSSLRPNGTIELMLVEKIAINLWKQRRLVNAEAANLKLQTRPEDIVAQVSKIHYGYLSEDKITVDDLHSDNAAHLEWCNTVLKEIEALPDNIESDLGQLEAVAPRIFEQLCTDTSSDLEDMMCLLKEDYYGFMPYIISLSDHCTEEIDKINLKPMFEELAKWVTAKNSIAQSSLQQNLSRYQTSLDNELFKTLKALREEQKFRLSTIEAIKVEDDQSE